MKKNKHKILVLDPSGMPHDWMTWTDAVILKVKGGVAWEYNPEIGLTIRGGTSRLTGNQTVVELAPIIATKGRFKFQRRTPPLTNKNLFQRDLYKCAYCGRHYSESKLSRDHIMPTSRGGKDVWLNVITACKSCNHDKGHDTLEEAGLELLYKPYVPNHFEHLILENRDILDCQREFLLPMLPEHSRVNQVVGKVM